MKNNTWILWILAAATVIAAFIFYNKHVHQQLLDKQQTNYFDSIQKVHVKNAKSKNSNKALEMAGEVTPTDDDCDNIIIINKTTIGTNYSTWLTQDFNGNCIVKSSCNFNGSCTDSIRKFSINFYQDSDTADVRKEDFSAWLQKNGQAGFICLNALYGNIEKAHKADRMLAAILASEPVKGTMTYADILKVINDSDPNNYTNDRYTSYMHFSYNWLGYLEMGMSPTFSADGGYFSIQLLKSIVEKRKNTPNTNDDIIDTTEFEFRNVRLGSKKRVVFSIKNGHRSDSDFYDFSQIPPLNVSGRVDPYSFSPL